MSIKKIDIGEVRELLERIKKDGVFMKNLEASFELARQETEQLCKERKVPLGAAPQTF